MQEEGLGLHSRSLRTLPEGAHCRSCHFGIQAWKSFRHLLFLGQISLCRFNENHLAKPAIGVCAQQWCRPGPAAQCRVAPWHSSLGSTASPRAAPAEGTVPAPALAAQKKMLKWFEAGPFPLEFCNHTDRWLQSCASAKLLTHCPGSPPSQRGSHGTSLPMTGTCEGAMTTAAVWAPRGWAPQTWCAGAGKNQT